MRWRSFFFPKPAAILTRAAIIVGIFPILGLFASHWWTLDLFNHPQRQYFAVILLLTLGLLGLKSYRYAAIAGVMMILPLSRIAPTWWNPTKDPGGTSLRVATYNVYTANKRYDDALKWINKTDPDFIFLPEVDEIWAAELMPLRKTHPHAIEHIVEGNFGFALYSKHPILNYSIKPCGQMGLPLLIAQISTPKGDLTLLGAHPVPPTTEFWASERDAFLKEIARTSTSLPGPFLLLGDLNATRWSHGMKPILESGWIDTSQGHSTHATWMNKNPLIAIPIDHIMFLPKKGVPMHCRNRWVGPDLGSDHRPVVADIVW